MIGRGQYNALIIEDEKDLNDTMSELLKETGKFKFVIQAKDGLEGYQKVTKQPFDLIILDIAMPRKNGLEFLQQYSKEESFNPKKILVYSGHLDRAKLVVMTEKYSIKNFMVKPFEEEALYKMIDKIVES